MGKQVHKKDKDINKTAANESQYIHFDTKVNRLLACKNDNDNIFM